LRQRQLIATVSSAIQELCTLPDEVSTSDSAAAAAPPVDRLLTVGTLHIDTWRQVATFEGRNLSLTPTEFRILLCLAEHCGQMLTYSEIVRCAQGYDALEVEASELVKPHIYHLRQKIEPDPSAPQYLLNVRGKGYILQL
jgi:DNA-binding response OmpR family regulator